MQYKYCANENFEDFASGRVLSHKYGFPNFPVRLAQEIYCRCLNYLKNKTDICIYDPCCGSAYMLAAVGFLNFNNLNKIVCSDYDDNALEFAGKNLNLLSVSGLQERIAYLENLYIKFNKPAHLEAIESAKRLMKFINEEHSVNILSFKADILSENSLKDKNFKADIVFTDIPYGNLVSWQEDNDNNINILLNNLKPVITSDSVIAVCSSNRQRIKSENYARLEKQQIGKRKFEILTLR